jgi:hypothetical protein
VIKKLLDDPEFLENSLRIPWEWKEPDLSPVRIAAQTQDRSVPTPKEKAQRPICAAAGHTETESHGVWF